MFSKILVANRGEIAVRIIRACKEMGIATVAIFSEADKDALHVSLADESYCIGGPLAKDSYLNMTAVLSVALATQAAAIHPGYGFLAENAQFARLCQQNSIAFIGPPIGALEQMGDKAAAKNAMKQAGIPVIPGCNYIRDLQHAKEQAQTIGFPLLIKARAGGGGRGIRLIKNPDELNGAYRAAAVEAKNAFGSETVYMERYLWPVKHIEMQILADHHGNIVCLGERDCSIQRRNQKLLEESPAILLPAATRAKMIATSIKAASAINYHGAGTVEYLLDEEGNYYFMEMNTRLQVEHPVTEMVTGIDLVKWQLRIAAGLKLDFDQHDVEFKGHAIECRIIAENPYHSFRPSCGKVELLFIPGGPWVRFDTDLYQGYTISPYYDSMIGKLIVHARTRDEAIRKMKAALCELIIEGIEHNAYFQEEILSAPEFEAATYTTDFMAKILAKGGSCGGV